MFDIPGEKFIGVGLDVTATSGKQLFPKKKQNLFTSIRNIHKIYCHNVGQENDYNIQNKVTAAAEKQNLLLQLEAFTNSSPKK